ncbi:hypothetical protein EJ08DRAFT_172709 [Tothia fuscella]|uniref:Uncharacterized protein n=1 Tax=Tothia fuscella TaxID=1048955 RepID=A0A9P4NT41_9PEZI|nr:hypothetical protein EJ08DRAFT_172709 [Tothia fuscella]
MYYRSSRDLRGTNNPITSNMDDNSATSSPDSADSSSIDQNTRPKISDGKSMREIWRPSDGNGDPDPSLFERTRYKETGHPTWKIYCGDAPERVNGLLEEPPKFCYLDDRSAYKILHWDGFTKAEKGRYWKHDFGTKGELRPNRKCSGRPAFLVGGEVAYVDGPAKKYRFQGAMDPRDIAVVNEEIGQQKAARALVPVDPVLLNNPVPKEARSAALIRSMEAASPSPSVSIDSGRKRSVSPLTAMVEDPTAKRPRYMTNKKGYPNEPMGDPETMRNTIAALRERNEAGNDKIISLQRCNADLKAQVNSIQALWGATTEELKELRKGNRRLCQTLEAKSNGVASEMLVVSLKEEGVAYRELAKHVYERFKAAEVVVRGYGTTALNSQGENGVILETVHKLMQRDLREIKDTMKQVLGDKWDEFENGPPVQGSRGKASGGNKSATIKGVAQQGRRMSDSSTGDREEEHFEARLRKDLETGKAGKKDNGFTFTM